MYKKLQNHPGVKFFPVTSKNHGQSIVFSGTFFQITTFLAKSGFFFMGWGVISIIAAFFAPELSKVYYYYGGALILFGALLYWGLGSLYVSKEKSKPVSEQSAYYKFGNVHEISEQEKQALSLIAFENFYAGSWPETLELYPATVRLKGSAPTFRYLHTITEKDSKIYLSERWRILGREGYEHFMQDLLHGTYSKKFAEFLYLKEYNRDSIEPIASLAEVEIDDVITTRKTPTQMPRFIWSMEIATAISVTRWAFMSNYITEGEAWQHIENFSRLAHYLFKDMDAYYKNLRIGYAFTYFDKEVQENLNKMIDEFETDKIFNWPIRSTTWVYEKINRFQSPHITAGKHNLWHFKFERTVMGFRFPNQTDDSST